MREGAEYVSLYGGLDELSRMGRKGCSFSDETLVSTDEGKKAIDEVTVGDHVLAYDEETGTTGYYTVTATMVHLDPVLVYVTLGDETIETTPEHPFYVMASAPWLEMGEQEGRWVEAGKLEVGERVRSADGSTGVVQAVAVVAQTQAMYNLTVADAHTFFVGEHEWLTHNQSICKRPGGYSTYDIDLHGNLSPGGNRAPGQSNTAADYLIQSHHIIQDEWAQTNIPGYDRKLASAILLPSSTGQTHALISAAQRAAARQRVLQGLSPWTSTTIQQEFHFAYQVMVNAGVPIKIVQRAIKDAYKYFDSLGGFQ